MNSETHSFMSNSMTPWTVLCQAFLSMEFSRQRGLLTQGSNLGLPHCRQILLPFEPPGKPPKRYMGLKIFISFTYLETVFFDNNHFIYWASLVAQW